tara:strand:+ start:627 stop:812 length:186 start_codon:yes stop_codon:yes gene_type:complete
MDAVIAMKCSRPFFLGINFPRFRVGVQQIAPILGGAASAKPEIWARGYGTIFQKIVPARNF